MAFPTKPTDDLLDRARRLDSNSLGEIHDRFYPEIYRYVYYRLGSDLLSEDIASEVFLRFLDALHRKRGPNRNLRGWLFGTASHLVNDYLRGQYRQREENLDEQAQETLTDPVSPEGQWDETWLRKKVWAAFQKLTSEQQHVLALRFAEERSLDETAKVVGKSINAVKALQFRALASLRRLLEDEKVQQ